MFFLQIKSKHPLMNFISIMISCLSPTLLEEAYNLSKDYIIRRIVIQSNLLKFKHYDPLNQNPCQQIAKPSDLQIIFVYLLICFERDSKITIAIIFQHLLNS